jgi:hypothetical protein
MRPLAAATAGAVYRADMSQCRPAASLTRTFEKDRWQLIEYETEHGVKGLMASAYPDQRCGELTLPLEVKGVHRIYMGVNYTKAGYPEWPNSQLEVKLTGEPGFRRIGLEAGSQAEDGKAKIGVNNDIYKSIQETYWKTADLTGKSLVIRQPPAAAHIANISYVKFVPLSADEERRWRDSQPGDSTRRLALIYCTAHLSGATRGNQTVHPTSRAWFEDELAPYTGSDFKLFVFEALRGNFCLYKTKIGDVGSPDNRWGERWIDPLAAFTELCHKRGVKILASLRMIGPQYPMNREPIAWAHHYWRHREWTKRDRDGVPLTNWSLAYPEVRSYWLSLLAECLDYGIDGIQLHLNRATPFVFYEEPAVRGFRERYGEDPRKLPENDPRWQMYRAGFVTEFVREVKELVGRKPGRELAITIYGQAHKYDKEPGYHPIRYNLDVETWLRGGLVDYIMPSPGIDLAMLKKWRTIAGDRVHLWPDLMPRTQPAESYLRLAKKYYEAGADGFCLWDGEGRPPHMSEWAGVQQLGHRDKLDELLREAPSYYARVPLKYLGGFSVKESFHDG